MGYQPGDLIAGKYKLIENVGGGAMGQVFKAEHLMMNKTVAIKILHPDICENAEMLQRFKREAQSAAAISHSNICTVMDFDVMENGDFYLVMEFLEGDTLKKRLKENGPMPPDKAVFIMQQLLSVLQCAHDHGIVHRDVKPENIALVFQDGINDFVKLLDFGIAHQDQFSPVAMQAKQDGEFKTQMGFLYGTPEYVAPEQAEGGDIDSRVDLYACGIILFEMLMGHVPFSGSSVVRVLNMQVCDPPPHIDIEHIEYGAELDEIIQKLLEKDRDKRFQSALSVSEALARLPFDPVASSMSVGITAVRMQVHSGLLSDPAKSTPGPEESADVFEKAADAARESYKQFAKTTPGSKIVALFKKMSKRGRKICALVILLAMLAAVVGFIVAIVSHEPALPEIDVTLVGTENAPKLEKIAEVQPFIYESDFAVSDETTLRKDLNVLKSVEAYYQRDYQDCVDNLLAVNDRYQAHPNYLRLRIQAETKLATSLAKSKSKTTNQHLKEVIDALIEDLVRLADLVPDAPVNDAILEAYKFLFEDIKDKVSSKKNGQALADTKNKNVAYSLAMAIIWSTYDSSQGRKKNMLTAYDAFAPKSVPDWMVYAMDAWRLDKEKCKQRAELLEQAFATQATNEELYKGLVMPLYMNLRLNRKKDEQQQCKASAFEKRDCNYCMPWIKPTYEAWKELADKGELDKAVRPTFENN